LLVTSHPIRELAVSVSLAGLKQAHPLVAANLFIIHIDPFEILANKVKQMVRSELLVNKVLASPIYKSLIEVAPGLKEIAFLGRLHQLSQDSSQEGKTGKFDFLVWDAPATGHFLQTLKVSQSFENYLSGPFALLGKEVAEFFSEVSNFSLIPVTTLEEMAIDETIELCEKLAGELKIKPSGLICNMTSPLLASPDSVFDNLQSQIVQQGGNSSDLKFILDRIAIERSLFKKLQIAVETKFHIVQRKPSWNSDLDLLLDISRDLDGISRT
jgi:anion-transporting  ArsA/GET3 family ATPase